MNIFRQLRLGVAAKSSAIFAKSRAAAGEVSYVHIDERLARLKQTERRQIWLWVAQCVVTALGIAAFVLLSFPAFREQLDPVYRVEPSHAMPALAALLLLFNAHSVYRQWELRRERRAFTHLADEASETNAKEISRGGAATDDVTGLASRTGLQEWLSKELAQSRARRKPTALLMLRLNALDHAYRAGGNDRCETALREAGERIRGAIRGSDLAAHLGDGEFAVGLSSCALAGVEHVLKRVGVAEVDPETQSVRQEFTPACVDYHAGELPAEFIQRARQLLKLYEQAEVESDVKVVARA